MSYLRGFVATTVVSRVQVFGETLGGEAVESEAWDFPILGCETTADRRDACLGCTAAAPNQPLLEPCHIGQDVPPDCRLTEEYLDR